MGFSWYWWLKFKYLLKEKTKLNLEKRFGFRIKKGILIYVKWRDFTLITRKNGPNSWFQTLQGPQKHYLNTNQSNLNLKHLKNRLFLLSSTRSIDWWVIWPYLKKKLFGFFWPKGWPLPRKLAKFFFRQFYSNHASICGFWGAFDKYMGN